MVTRQKVRYPREAALKVAQELIQLLLPDCERIEVAGSLRRGKPDVGDIELLCISRYGGVLDLFGDNFSKDLLGLRILELIADEALDYRLNKAGHSMFGVKNKLLTHVPSGIPVDVFSTDARNWGMAWVVRTGPKEFNVSMMSRFRQRGMRGEAYGGVIDQEGQRHNCPDEETVFRLLGWPYLSPEKRGWPFESH